MTITRIDETFDRIDLLGVEVDVFDGPRNKPKSWSGTQFRFSSRMTVAGVIDSYGYEELLNGLKYVPFKPHKNGLYKVICRPLSTTRPAFNSLKVTLK